MSLFLRLSFLLAFAMVVHEQASATDLSGIITTDTTLTAAGNPHKLVGPLTIKTGVRLILGPGVVVISQGDQRIYVNGILEAAGTPTQPVVLRATDAASRGSWSGLYVSKGGSCQLAYTTIKNAFTNLTTVDAALQLQNCNLLQAQEDGLMAWGATTLQATDCHFDNNGRRGLYLEGDQASGFISRCDFRLNGEYPVFLKATLVEMLWTGNVYVSNGVSRIGVSCSLVDDIQDEDTWIAQAVDFDTTAGAGEHLLTINPGGQLTLARGVRVRCGGIQVKGKLRAFGEEKLKCALLSSTTSPGSGDWPGVIFQPGSSGDLGWLDLAFATTGITADGANVRLTNSVVRDCLYDGLRVTGGSEANVRFCQFVRNGRNGIRLEGTGLTGIVKGCSFRLQGNHPVWTQAANLALLRNLNRYQDNAIQAIAVACGADPDLSSGIHTWVAQGIALDCTADSQGGVLNIGSSATLILQPEITLLSAGVINRGRLEVRGTSTRPIKLLPATTSPKSGDWAGLIFAGGNGLVTGACLEYATIGLTLADASPTISECILRASQYDGLRCQGNSSPVVALSRFLDNGRHGVLVEDTAQPNLGDLGNLSSADDGRNNFSGNQGYDVYNTSNKSISAQGNRWPSADLAAIAARIYDHSDDSRYGQVIFSPFAGTTPNNAPLLTWIGTSDYANDGLHPEVGTPATLLRFRVRYADAEGMPPSSMLLHVASNSNEIAHSPFPMDRGTQTDYAAGVVYNKTVTLPAGRHYTYWFSASDGELQAVGDPTNVHVGPLVNTTPKLIWVGSSGWTTDGIHPDTGTAGVTIFRFRVKYLDADADLPTSILCHITREGISLPGSPFVMSWVQGTAYRQGVTYEYATRLPSTGSYAYYFEASDGLARASGEATNAIDGPIVSEVTTSPALLSLTMETGKEKVVGMRWRLATAATIKIRVMNLAGHTVAIVLRARPCPGGEGETIWSRRSITGGYVPPGSYLVVFEAQTEQGWEDRRIIPLILF